MALERELKYSYPDGQVPALADLIAALAHTGASVTDLGSSVQTDLYYDDESGSVQRAGMALRVRTVAGRKIATLKSRGSVMHGVHERDEFEEELPKQELHEGNAPGAWPDELAERLSGVDMLALGPRMIVHTRRHRFVLSREGVSVAELAFDEVVCQPAGEVALEYSIDHALFHEVELEALTGPDGATPTVAELAAYGQALQNLLPLYSSDVTKLERATTLLGAFAE